MTLLSNSTAYRFHEIRTLYFGRCFTICPLQKYAAKERAVFSFKYKQNIQVYVHETGEEFWLTGTNSFPSEVGTFVLQVKGDDQIVGAGVKITQKDTTLLSLDSTPCLEVDNDGDNGNQERC